MRSPALRDPHAAAHRRSAAGRGLHARPGLGAQSAPGRLLEGLAEGALPCTLGGGRRGREEGEREPPGEGTGWEGVLGAHPQRPLQPEAAEAPVTETHARQRPRARTLACTPACTLAHVRTPAQSWLLIRTLALRQLGLMTPTRGFCEEGPAPFFQKGQRAQVIQIGAGYSSIWGFSAGNHETPPPPPEVPKFASWDL